jgi:bacteriocin-like protein
MKSKKLKKVTKFIFKKNDFSNLNKEQMQKINGGNILDGGDYSGNPGCGDKPKIKTLVTG